MAAPPDEQSLESRINKATNPLNRETDWESIQLFCDQLSNEPEGPQLATRLLAHKIQSPQEWEAMQALTVLETCVKNCGKRFHNEVGKFRFLNELIKVVSPKYLGSRAPEPVKKKVLEMMYSWTVSLPEETKISDAYQMLKKQGIIKQDPDLPDDKPCPPPPPRPKNAIFEDEEKSKDQKRMEKVSKRVNAIQEVKESVGLLTQLLGDYSKESGSHSNEELIKDLYQRCEKMRPTLFRLASDTEDNDEALAEILQANDSLTQVINLYRQLVKGEEVNGDTSSTATLPGSTALLDLTGLDTSPSAQSFSEFPSKTSSSQELGISLLDDELMSLAVTPAPAVLLPVASATKTPVTAPVTSTKSLDELDLLGKTLLQQSLPPESLQVKWDKLQSQSKPTLRDLQIKSGTNTATTPSPVLPFSSEPGTLLNSQLTAGITPASTLQDDISLVNVTVPLESIKPSSLLPVTIFDKHSLRVLFHFARDSPPARPDVLVVIISMLSSAPVPITNVRFQAAVPKTMRVKLQPPSGSDLPAFNPILPPAAITQVLLLANPHKGTRFENHRSKKHCMDDKPFTRDPGPLA
ncbi:ADP-ribosylation factor-binding GGA1-like protein [Labeo rohita]|uniref:ADP-ribosylation factor-binding GGA1-like protein n=1 Tax=Labeo rohita TaxID=84645 RepID=A0A498N338_LABRO|nr:ADP-ribosylation factor-binding GGA1-like protein [Labeo rohita]